MKVVKEENVVTITLDQYEAKVIKSGLPNQPVVTVDGICYAAELRLELAALLGDPIEKRNARLELDALDQETAHGMFDPARAREALKKAAEEEAAYREGN
jgi:hypothetical protein